MALIKYSRIEITNYRDLCCDLPNLLNQGSKLKKNSSRLLAIIKEKSSPNAKMQSPDNTRNIKIMWK